MEDFGEKVDIEFEKEMEKIEKKLGIKPLIFRSSEWEKKQSK